MANPNRFEAIRRLLLAKAQPDMAAWFRLGSEVQVNVAKDDGIRKEGAKQTYTDGAQTWFAFRIPKNAWNEPEDNSGDVMTWSIFDHAEAIGMTGWNYLERRSHRFGYDFDALVGHSQKHAKRLTDDELAKVKEAACAIPWVEVRRSTSGSGLHLYVHLQTPHPTKNHTEHAALGQAILAEMSAVAGFDFTSKVDANSNNMWVWARKMPLGPDGTQRSGIGLQLIKKSVPLDTIPLNWERYTKVQKGERKKSLPEFVDGEQETKVFDETAGQQPRTSLDDDHKKLVDWLQKNQGWGWWDADHHMLVTHTWHLKRAHAALSLKGPFETDSPASQPDEQNVFLFPIRSGAWTCRRYTRGVAEARTWSQDGKGWTRCYFNRDPDLRDAAIAAGGTETAEGAFKFSVLDDVEKVLPMLGGNLEVPGILATRPAKVFPHKDGRRLIVEVEQTPHDNPQQLLGWYSEKGKRWRTVLNARIKTESDVEVGTCDDAVRHCTTEGCVDAGWYVKVGERWNLEPKTNTGLAMLSLGHKKPEVDLMMGASVLKPWTLVNRPFDDEYPGDRLWNVSRVRLLYPRSDEPVDPSMFPHWRKVFTHIGSGLDQALSIDPWAQTNDVKHGFEYLEYWYASLLQNPYASLPYLFLWSKEEDTGKSTLHQAASLLFSDDGIVEANAIVSGKDMFNGPMESAVLCYLEEINLSEAKGAYQRIKNWVTSSRISIRKIRMDAYQMNNTSHWIHCANDHNACPIFPGDTRITMIHVPVIRPADMIPKDELRERMKREAPHFMNYLLQLDVPNSGSRLAVPVINTSEKEVVGAAATDAITNFIEERCKLVPGALIPFSDFYDKFKEQCEPEESHLWGSRYKVSKGIPPQFPIGKRASDTFIGNLTWKESQVAASVPWVLRGRILEPASVS